MGVATARRLHCVNPSSNTWLCSGYIDVVVRAETPAIVKAHFNLLAFHRERYLGSEMQRPSREAGARDDILMYFLTKLKDTVKSRSTYSALEKEWLGSSFHEDLGYLDPEGLRIDMRNERLPFMPHKSSNGKGWTYTMRPIEDWLGWLALRNSSLVGVAAQVPYFSS